MVNTNIKVLDIEKHLPLYVDGVLQQKEISEAEEKFISNLMDEDQDTSFYENISVERKLQLIKRNLQIVRELKEKYNGKCQICGQTFLMDTGEYYCEAHHIIPLTENGNQSPDNVIILCANHHRMFHYAKNRIIIGELTDKKRIIQIGEDTFTVKFK